MEGEAEQDFKSFLQEATELEKLLQPSIFLDAESNAWEKICNILERYQEQPELLDPHLERFVGILMGYITDHLAASTSVAEKGTDAPPTSEPVAQPSDAPETQNKGTVWCVFKVIYVLAKIRGYKTVTRFFPHEVKHLEPAVSLLFQQGRAEYSTWETRYGLFLWLSILVLVPFDLTTVDTSFAGGIYGAAQEQGTSSSSGKSKLIAVLVELGQSYLGDPGASREAAAVMLSRLFSRPDMETTYLEEFAQWCVKALAAKPNIHLVIGIYCALFEIVRNGPRSILVEKAPFIYENLVKDNPWAKNPNGLLRKLTVKVAQRIGLTYLRPQVAKWRYQKGNRSLLQGLRVSSEHGLGGAGVAPAKRKVEDGHEDQPEQPEGEEEEDVPEQLEEIIEQLLNGLRDKDTIVRWSAAKGIGRITMRLPSGQGDDVVGTVLDVFTRDDEHSWHGGCLAMAELARRGLLLPHRLPEVIPIALRALKYDVRVGAYSVGNNVRDSACYLVWAFARAYAPEVMAPFVQSLAQGLLTLAVFDREVNCRRAASAAFQENVGRQGNVPHGIEINTTADYLNLGNRQHAYTEVAKFVAAFPEYRQSLLEHLTTVKFKHWDTTIRELAAKSILRLTTVRETNDFFQNVALGQLLAGAMNAELCERHGSCLAIAAIILGLFQQGIVLSDVQQNAVLTAIDKIKLKGWMAGKGGNLTSQGVFDLIEKLAESKFTLQLSQVGKLQLLIDEGLVDPLDTTQFRAAHAFRALCEHYYVPLSRTDKAVQNAWEHVIGKSTRLTRSGMSPLVTRGHAYALGVLPSDLVYHKTLNRNNVFSIVSGLIFAADVKNQRDAETRKNAVSSLGQILCSIPAQGLRVSGDYFSTSAAENERNENNVQEAYLAAFTCFINATNDYSVDNRGDVGSWSREAAMRALEPFLPLLFVNGLLTRPRCTAAIQAILKQLVEKLDKVRVVAGEVLKNLLLQNELRTLLPEGQLLRRLFCQSPSSSSSSSLSVEPEIDFANPFQVFPKAVQLLRSSYYGKHVLAGLVNSIGGMTQSIVSSSGQALLGFLQETSSEDLQATPKPKSRVIVTVVKSYKIKKGSTKKQLVSKKKTVVHRKPDLVDRRASLLILADNLLDLAEENKSSNKVLLPVLKTLEFLLTNACFDGLADPAAFSSRLHVLLQSTIRGANPNIHKILGCVPVFGGLLALAPSLREELMSSVFKLLTHPFPKVRRAMADELYSQLMTHEHLANPEVVQDALDLIGEALWESDPCVTESTNLYSILSLPIPERSPDEPLLSPQSQASGSASNPASQAAYQSFIDNLRFSGNK